MGVATLLTREEFLALPGADDYELIDGELREREMGAQSSSTAAEAVGEIRNWNRRAGLGYVLADAAGLDIFPPARHYIPRPDGGWISYARLGGGELPEGYLRVAPELALEVVSTHDVARALERKVADYLGAGVDEVWVLYPDTRRVHVFRRGERPEILGPDDTLTSELLPGFSAPVAMLFPAVR